MRRSSYRPEYPQEAFIVPLLKRKIEEMLNSEELHSVRRVLDVGAGAQPLRPLVLERSWQYFSMDHEPQPGLNTDFIQSIDQALSPQVRSAGPYDLLLLTEVLEHVADWPLAFQNLSTLCRPDGFLIVTAPFIYQLHEEPHDYWRPTSHAIQLYAQKAGFELIKLERAGDGFEVLGTVLANLSFYSKARTLADRIYFRLLKFLEGRLSESIRSGRIEQIAGVHSPLYLSNIALLRRLHG